MNKKSRLFVMPFLVILGALFGINEANGQGQSGWSKPFLLSNDERKASEAYSVADQFGIAHFFWIEELEDQRSIIQYAQYEGETWSRPIDIYVTQPFKTIGNISTVIDKDGILHVVWSEGDSGPAFYTRVPAYGAVSVQNWEEPKILIVPAKQINLQIDAEGTFHVLFVRFSGQEAGVYYMRSQDHGARWSEPLWLDPDILPEYGPRALNFIMDDEGGMHAVWFYVPQTDTGGDWVRYAHSLDGGETWSQPFTIDKIGQYSSDDEYQLSAAGPVMAVEGQNVHIIWAGGKLNYRHHRHSTDAGQTWSEPARVFGGLNGQAGDGMAVDGNGRVHFFGQIRFPMGIYHAVWEDGKWSRPSLVYLIKYGSDDPVIENKVEAHVTNPVILAGNQIILTFADPPPDEARRLFYMELTLDDVTPAEPRPIPQSTIDSSPTVTQDDVEKTPAPARQTFPDQPTSGESAGPGTPLLYGFLSTVVLVGGTVFLFRLAKLRN